MSGGGSSPSRRPLPDLRDEVMPAAAAPRPLAIYLPSVAVSQFTWRYQLPLLVLLPPAGALGIAALTGRTAPHEKRE